MIVAIEDALGFVKNWVCYVVEGCYLFLRVSSFFILVY